MIARIALAALFTIASTALTSLAADPEVFASKEGKFKAQFPEKPKETDRTLGTIKIKMYIVENKNGAYLVGTSDLPLPADETDQKVQERLDASRDSAIKFAGGKLVDSKAVTLDKKYPGRDFSAAVDKPAEGVIRAKSYIAGIRLYQIMVIGTKDFATSKEADAFLESFKITE